MAWNGPILLVTVENAARAATERDVVDALGASIRMRDVNRNFRYGVDGGVLNATPGTALVSRIIATRSTDSSKGQLVPVDWLIHGYGAAGGNIIPAQSTVSTPPTRRD